MANSTQRHEQPTRSYCTALAEKNLTIPEELEELAIVPIKRFYTSPTVLSVCQSQRVLYRENGNGQRDAKPMAAQDCTVQATDEDGNYDTEEKQLLDHLSIELDRQWSVEGRCTTVTAVVGLAVANDTTQMTEYQTPSPFLQCAVKDLLIQSAEDDFQLLHGYIDMFLRAMFNLVIIDLPIGTIISIASSISAPPATHTRDRRTYSNNEDCKRGLPDVPDESRLFAIYNAIVTEVEEATRKLCINWCSHLYLACPWLGPPLLILTHTNKLAVDEVKQCKEQLLTTSEAIRSEIVNEIQQYSGEFSESAQPMIDFSIKEVKLFNSVDVFEFSNDLTERSNIENLKLPLENHCKSFKVVLARLWEKVIEFVNEQYTMSYISLSEVTKNLSSNGPQIILYNYHYAEEVEELKSISGVLFHHHHSCDEQWKQHCKGVIQCHVVYQQMIKELCIPLLYNDIAIRNVDLANAVLLSVHGLSPDGILSAAVRSEKSYQWWAQSINNAEILQYYRGLGALCSWTFCLATQLNAVIAQMKYAVSSATVQSGNSNCLPPFTEQKSEENEMEPKAIRNVDIANAVLLSVHGLSPDGILSAAARSEKIDQWWTQSINNAETLQRYQGLGALCSWTLCLATQLNAVIAHVQRTAWYAACTRVEPTEFPDLKEEDAAPSPQTSPEVAGYIHSNELEWMFYPSRHGIYSAVPCPQPCDVLCYMADVQTDNPNPLPFQQNLESAVPSTTLTSPATAGRQVAASARGRVESAVLFDNQKLVWKRAFEDKVQQLAELLQCYRQSTEYSAYEKVEKLLDEYVSNWYTPDASELKQYLQAVSADERFELKKKQYGWFDDTALHVAAKRGDTEVMRCLLKMVEPQKRYELLKIQGEWWGGTPLHAAASRGRTEVMRCMLELVEPENQIQLLDIPNTYNKTALDVAEGEETVELIRQYSGAATKEVVRWLRWLNDDKTNPLAFGHSPTDGALHWRQSNVNNNDPSAMSYCDKLEDMLADYVCNPWHTLDTSVLKQYLQAVSADGRFELLKKYGRSGYTVLHEAVERGHTRVMTAMLESVEPQRRCELLKMQNRCGKPALNVAAERGDARAMRCLLEQVEPGSVYELLKIRNEFPFRYGFMYGKTAIEEAAWRGHTKVINAMLAMVEPENQLQLLDTPYWHSRTGVRGEKMAKVIRQYRRRAEIAVMEKLERLLAVYVYVPWSRLNTSELQQCLQAFSAGKRFELLKKQCGRGTTALHQAAKRGHTEVMRCLLKLVEARKRHELLKKQDVSSSTPLHAAARCGGTEAVRCMLELVELEEQTNTPDWLSRTALDVAKGDKPTQIMRQRRESTAGKFRESPRRQRTATEGGCLLESHLHPTSRAFATPSKDDANTSNEKISTGDPHHGERSHKLPMVEKAIEPTQVVREETTQATQEERENSVSQQSVLGDNTPVSLIPSNVVFQSDQSSLSLSESVPRPASTYQEEPSCSAPNVHGFRSSKIPSKQPLARNHCLKSVDCKPPSIGANILQDTKWSSSANERKYFAVTAAHSFLSENDVEWIFNPSRHGISSAIPSYNRGIACYPIARYPDNQNPLLPLSLQKKLAEMSPREYLSAVLRELSLEERESLMIDEKQRRNTFLVNWPHDSNLSGVKLAQAGFYCVDDYDRVQCVFCRGSLHKWEAEDNPMTEHAKLFPFCRFVKGLECGNKEYKNDLLLADELKNITLLTMPEMKKNRDGSVSTNSGAFGISTNKAAVIKYAPYETRKNTYGRWPAANVIRPEPLCEAGFYYTGFDDQVRCFFCSGGLREWSSEDNPWEEHARWFPDCSYLLQHKGEIYVTEVHARTEDGKKCPRKTVLQKKTEKEWKQKVSTQQAMYELIVVKLNHDRRAVDIAINRNGKTFESAKEMVEAVYQVEEDGNMDSDRMETDYQAIKPAIDFMAAAAKDQPIIVQEAAMGTDMVDGLQPGRMDTADSGPPPASCKTCYKKTSQVVQASQVGLPCGHLIYCDKCIQDEKLKTDRNNGYKSRCPAPQCAAVLTGAIKAFLN